MYSILLQILVDMEADISQLEAPTFTTISRGPPEPMLRLKFDHKVSLIGEKVLNPMIHCCDQCEKPILIYGRMIPCKHVFCLRCARAEPIKICPRCKEKVIRVEQSGLGTVFMCTHGGSRYGNTGCRRTYLSQRDLQAHINHRHVTPLASAAENKISEPKVAPGSQRKSSISDSSLNRPGNTRTSQSSIPSTGQTPQTLAQDLSNYFSPSQSQYGSAQQSFATGNMSQQASAHSLPVVTSSSAFYSSYAQYNPSQTQSHYSNASAYSSSGSVIQSSMTQQTSQAQQAQQSQSQQAWQQQQPYYR